MIKIDKMGDTIFIKGHSKVDICSSTSSIMYTTVNALKKIDEKSFSYYDDEIDDSVTIRIFKRNKITDILIDNMLDMFNQLSEQYPDEVKLSIN